MRGPPRRPPHFPRKKRHQQVSSSIGRALVSKTKSWGFESLLTCHFFPVKGELKKTTWPWESDPKVKGFKKFRELWGSTLVVLIAMVFLGAFVASFDIFLHSVVNYLIQLAI